MDENQEININLNGYDEKILVKDLPKIYILYKALLAGWSINLKKKSKNEEIFEFVQKKSKLTKNLVLDDHLKELLNL